MHRIVHLVGSVLALAIFPGCEAPGSPESTAKAFWDAIRAGDRAAAAAFATDGSRDLIDDSSIPADIGPALFGEPLRNENAAIVRTSMVTNDGDVELTIVFNTHLVLEQERWKVDLIGTNEEITRAMFAAGVKRVGEAIGQGFQEFGDALERGAREVHEAVQEALEGIDLEH